MHPVNYYEASPLCCNPFQIEGHKAERSCLRPVNQNIIAALREKGITWVTVHMKICMSCRLRPPHRDTPEIQVIATEEDQRFEHPDPSLISPPSLSDSATETPSTGRSVETSINVEKIQGLLNFLEINKNERSSRLDRSNDNYRASVLKEFFLEILRTIKSWFPSGISDVADDFNNLMLNLKSEAETVDKKLKHLACYQTDGLMQR